MQTANPTHASRLSQRCLRMVRPLDLSWTTMTLSTIRRRDGSMRMVTTTTRMEFSNTKLVSFANDLESWSDEDDNV